jgi:hypothetical protein
MNCFVLRFSFYFQLSLLFLSSLGAVDLKASVIPRSAEPGAVQEDLERILVQAKYPKTFIQWRRLDADDLTTPVQNQVRIRCSTSVPFVTMEIQATDAEWGPTFYFGLQKLGFLFPHPRVQISPDLKAIQSACGQDFQWDPRLEFRGFHFHTQHPNEWVHGFLMGKTEIALEAIRWLARNGQNLLNIYLLRTPLEEVGPKLTETFEFAHRLGITTGINVSFALQQQKAFHLLNIGFISSWVDPTGRHREDEAEIYTKIYRLASEIPFDFLGVDLGTSEFTSTDYTHTLSWLEAAKEAVSNLGKQLFTKIHVSTNQSKAPYGNYNFLPAFASSEVGVLPHTVMFYTLQDQHAPVYRRQDFADMKKFAVDENKN